MKQTILFLTLILGAFLFSCESNVDDKTKEERPTEIEMAVGSMSQSGEDAQEALAVVKTSPKTKKLDCADIHIDTAENFIKVDYGSSPCTCKDGRVRSGSYTYYFLAKRLTEAGKARKIVFSDYKIDSVKVDGTLEASELTQNTDGNYNFNITFTDVSVATDYGISLSLTGTRDYEWIEGFGNADPTDDVYLVTGSLEGVIGSKSEVSALITSSLRYKTACWQSQIPYAVSGKCEYRIKGVLYETVDYGSGSCDKEVQVTKGRKTTTEILP